MKTPRSVDVEITSQCNLRCRYCYFFGNPASAYEDLPAEEWLAFIEELGNCSVMTVCLLGGEPFMRKDLPQIIEGIVKNRMRFSILTNGGLVDNDIAAFLKKTGRCDSIQVSLDGSRPETHDSCRGKGSFEAAMRGIGFLMRHALPVTVRVTLHKNNVSDLENIARFLLDEVGLPAFSTNAAGYLGACKSSASELLLSTAERQEAMLTLKRLSEKYPGRITATAGPLADARFWLRMEEARSKSSPPFPNGGRLTGCGCSFENIAVRSDGSYIPCNLLPHLALGRINRDPLDELWVENERLNALRDRSRISLSDCEFCSGCDYIPYCTGNCPAIAYGMTGQIDHPGPDACLRVFLADGGDIGNLMKHDRMEETGKHDR
jgi:SynChlorMet cassette radical SAM/SPASM protein ScmE